MRKARTAAMHQDPTEHSRFTAASAQFAQVWIGKRRHVAWVLVGARDLAKAGDAVERDGRCPNYSSTS
jgi:hypothetical protein